MFLSPLAPLRRRFIWRLAPVVLQYDRAIVALRRRTYSAEGRMTRRSESYRRWRR